MLQRKIYQLSSDGHEVNIFLRDQQRWMKSVTIQSIDGDLITLRYEIEDDGEVCTWEDIVRIESIGAVSKKLACVPQSPTEILLDDHSFNHDSPNHDSPNQRPDHRPIGE